MDVNHIVSFKLYEFRIRCRLSENVDMMTSFAKPFRDILHECRDTTRLPEARNDKEHIHRMPQ